MFFTDISERRGKLATHIPYRFRSRLLSKFLLHLTRVKYTSTHLRFTVYSDPVVNSNSNQRANIQRLLEKLILEEDQFDVHDILPNTVPDPASLNLESDYACPVGEVVMAPDCGKTSRQYRYNYSRRVVRITFSGSDDR
jgi:hypothetical protein